MPRLPVRQNQHAWAKLADDARNLEAVVVGVLDAAVRNVEGRTPTDLEDARGFGGLARPVFDCASGAHLALREVEDGGAPTEGGHLQQCATAGLLDIVAV